MNHPASPQTDKMKEEMSQFIQQLTSSRENSNSKISHQSRITESAHPTKEIHEEKNTEDLQIKPGNSLMGLLRSGLKFKEEDFTQETEDHSNKNLKNDEELLLLFESQQRRPRIESDYGIKKSMNFSQNFKEDENLIDQNNENKEEERNLKENHQKELQNISELEVENMSDSEEMRKTMGKIQETPTLSGVDYKIYDEEEDKPHNLVGITDFGDEVNMSVEVKESKKEGNEKVIDIDLKRNHRRGEMIKIQESCNIEEGKIPELKYRIKSNSLGQFEIIQKEDQLSSSEPHFQLEESQVKEPDAKELQLPKHLKKNSKGSDSDFKPVKLLEKVITASRQKEEEFSQFLKFEESDSGFLKNELDVEESEKNQFFEENNEKNSKNNFSKKTSKKSSKMSSPVENLPKDFSFKMNFGRNPKSKKKLKRNYLHSLTVGNSKQSDEELKETLDVSKTKTMKNNFIENFLLKIELQRMVNAYSDKNKEAEFLALKLKEMIKIIETNKLEEKNILSTNKKKIEKFEKFKKSKNEKTENPKKIVELLIGKFLMFIETERLKKIIEEIAERNYDLKDETEEKDEIIFRLKETLEERNCEIQELKQRLKNEKDFIRKSKDEAYLKDNIIDSCRDEIKKLKQHIQEIESKQQDEKSLNELEIETTSNQKFEINLKEMQEDEDIETLRKTSNSVQNSQFVVKMKEKESKIKIKILEKRLGELAKENSKLKTQLKKKDQRGRMRVNYREMFNKFKSEKERHIQELKLLLEQEIQRSQDLEKKRNESLEQNLKLIKFFVKKKNSIIGQTLPDIRIIPPDSISRKTPRDEKDVLRFSQIGQTETKPNIYNRRSSLSISKAVIGKSQNVFEDFLKPDENSSKEQNCSKSSLQKLYKCKEDEVAYAYQLVEEKNRLYVEVKKENVKLKNRVLELEEERDMMGEQLSNLRLIFGADL